MVVKDEIKLGVIGAGGRGELAYYAHRPEDSVRLVAGADIDGNVLNEFRKKFAPDVFVTEDYRQLLKHEGIDAVFITSPDYCHEEQAVAALEAGKHVYLEKPMAITTESCDRILRKAYDKKLKLYLGHNMRHMSFVLKMKELIDKGAIGKVKVAWCRHFVAYGGDSYFKDWHAEREKSTGLLLQKGAHDIDVLHWICGGYSKRVTAFGALTLYDKVTDRRAVDEPWDAEMYMENWPPLSQKKLNPTINVEDVSMMLMQLDNGVLASYQQCHYAPDAWRNYTFIGTEGRIENFGDEPGKCAIRLWNHRTDYNPDGDEQYPIPLEEGSHGGADSKIVAEFIAYLRGSAKIKTSAIAARNSVAAGCAATESLRNGGRPVDVPVPPDDIIAYFDKGVEQAL